MLKRMMKTNQDNYSRMSASPQHSHTPHRHQSHLSLMSTFLSMLYYLVMILTAAAAAAAAVAEDENVGHDDAAATDHFYEATTKTRTSSSPLSLFSFMRTAFSSSTSTGSSTIRRLGNGNLRGGVSSKASVHASGDINKGRTVLTFLYLSILGLCFLTPVIYYCRNLRQMREAVTTAQQANAAAANNDNHHDPLAQHAQNREEARAVRRKFLEERRARILQLFEPVRLVLREEHFPQSKNGDGSSRPAAQGNLTKTDTITSSTASLDQQQQQQDPGSQIEGNDDENDIIPPVSTDATMSYEFEDEDSLMIEIPLPGLSLTTPSGGMPGGLSTELPVQSAAAAAAAATTTTTITTPELRQVSGVCTICLCAFQVGSDIVWSSNSACEHVFHEACIEKWLMKQREGPLCPCCRRDFIVDPYDMEEVGDYDYNNNNNTTAGTSATPGGPSNVHQDSNSDNANNDDNDNFATATALTSPTITTATSNAATPPTITSNPISFLWMRASGGRNNNDANNHGSNNGSASA